jgi:hypothetical protein
MTRKTASFGSALLVAAVLLLASGASSADTFAVTVVSQTSSTITLGWTPQPGYGYLFSADGNLVSRTNDPSRNTVKFSKSFSTYEIAVIVKGATGTYPTAPPPPPKNQCEDGLDNDGDGKIDYPADPGCASLTDNDETDLVQPPPTGNVYVSVNGNDSTCQQGNASLPCKSFTKAYDIARNGDVVSVSAGTYPSQRIVRDEKYTTADTPDVIFRPAPGATVTVGNLEFGKSVPVEGGTANAPSNITVENMRDDGASSGCDWYVGTDAYWVTIVNGDACNLLIEQAKHTTVLGGDWGPCTVPGPCSNMKIVDSPYVTMDGMNVHDFRIVPGSGEHFECMFIVSGRDITVRNSTFTNCEYYDIFVQRYYGTLEGFLLIEYNTFGVPWDGQGHQNRPGALAFSPRGTPFRNVTIKCNTFAPGTGISVNDDGDGTVYENFVIIPAGDPSC